MLEALFEKVAALAKGATYAGSGTAVAFGFTRDEWQVIGVIGGLAVAVFGLILKSAIDIYFKNQHLKLAASRASLFPEEA